jgi:Fur family iron response transcriptional regulator
MKKAKEILKKLKLRPTLQRVAITETLLRKKEVHVTAYSLEKMLVKSKVYISRATIYNNLNELSSKGFLKKVIVKKDKMWFDTNLSKHHHFYDEEEDKLVDIEESDINFSKFPKVPKGKKIKSVDIVINIKKH